MKKLIAAALLALSLGGCASFGQPRTTPTSPPRQEIYVKVPVYPPVQLHPHIVPKPSIPKLPYKPTIPDVKLKPSLPKPGAHATPAAKHHSAFVARWILYWQLLRDHGQPAAQAQDVIRDVAPSVTQVIPSEPEVKAPAPEDHRKHHWLEVVLGAILVIVGIVYWHERKR